MKKLITENRKCIFKKNRMYIPRVFSKKYGDGAIANVRWI